MGRLPEQFEGIFRLEGSTQARRRRDQTEPEDMANHRLVGQQTGSNVAPLKVGAIRQGDDKRPDRAPDGKDLTVIHAGLAL
jgi:hypothetical protein